MKNLWHFLKKIWWLLLTLFIAPLIVIFTFSVKEYLIHDIDLSAGEWANLFGSVFSYWGTVLLGILAFWQNERIVDLEERNMKIKERELKTSNIPNFVFEDAEVLIEHQWVKIKFDEIHEGTRVKNQCTLDEFSVLNTVDLRIYLKNQSDSDAYEIEVFDDLVNHADLTDFLKVGLNKRNLIKKNDILVLNYNVKFKNIRATRNIKIYEIQFDMNYKNLYGYCFYNLVNVFVGLEEKNPELIISITIDGQKEGRGSIQPNVIY